MTDLERIELACRRIADRERTSNPGTLAGTDAVVYFAVLRVFELLAAELAAGERRTKAVCDEANPTHCVHRVPMTAYCQACERM